MAIDISAHAELIQEMRTALENAFGEVGAQDKYFQLYELAKIWVEEEDTGEEIRYKSRAVAVSIFVGTIAVDGLIDKCVGAIVICRDRCKTAVEPGDGF